MGEAAQRSAKPGVERLFEQGLFASRWLMAPFYAGLVLALVALLVAFGRELAHELTHIGSMSSDEAVVMCLSLIDMSLAGNLLLIVIFSGYESFVSRMDLGPEADRPTWMGTIDYAGMKMKLIASLVAITAVALLRATLKRAQGQDVTELELTWLVAIHVTFLISGVLLALMDFIVSKTGKH